MIELNDGEALFAARFNVHSPIFILRGDLEYHGSASNFSHGIFPGTHQAKRFLLLHAFSNHFAIAWLKDVKRQRSSGKEHQFERKYGQQAHSAILTCQSPALSDSRAGRTIGALVLTKAERQTTNFPHESSGQTSRHTSRQGGTYYRRIHGYRRGDCGAVFARRGQSCALRTGPGPDAGDGTEDWRHRGEFAGAEL